MQYFAQRDKPGKLFEYAGVCEKVTIHDMSDLESYHKRDFFRALTWRGGNLNEQIYRCDASMSLIKKYGDVSAIPKPPDHN